jgi:hypothetical protein
MANKVFVWSGSSWEEVITSVSSHAQEHLAGGLDPLVVGAPEIASAYADNRDVLVADGSGGTRFEKHPNAALSWWMS